MKEISRTLFIQYPDEAIIISAIVLAIMTTLFVIVFVINRKKYRQLKHQIPASVVKNYLDSIIQNSSSLKSSLFRGGGIEIGEGIPSVIPVGSIQGGGNVSAGGASQEELNQKMAQIAALESQLAEKNSTISSLESQLENLKGAQEGGETVPKPEYDRVCNELEELKKQLEAAKAAQGSGGGDPEAAAKLEEVSKERDSLKERLQEYEIIEDDLANLKRLQQENEQLKKALADAGGSAPAAEPEAKQEAPAPAPEEPAAAPEQPAPEPQAAEEAEPEPAAEPAPTAEAAAPEEEAKEEEAPKIEGDGKSAEDLLSEFEKMLGD